MRRGAAALQPQTQTHRRSAATICRSASALAWLASEPPARPEAAAAARSASAAAAFFAAAARAAAFARSCSAIAARLSLKLGSCTAPWLPAYCTVAAAAWRDAKAVSAGRKAWQ